MDDREEPEPPTRPEDPYIRVEDRRPADYDGTCLRPLGLCELGGCCDVCFYRPGHPRFAATPKSGG